MWTHQEIAFLLVAVQQPAGTRAQHATAPTARPQGTNQRQDAKRTAQVVFSYSFFTAPFAKSWGVHASMCLPGRSRDETDARPAHVCCWSGWCTARCRCSRCRSSCRGHCCSCSQSCSLRLRPLSQGQQPTPQKTGPPRNLERLHRWLSARTDSGAAGTAAALGLEESSPDQPSQVVAVPPFAQGE